MVAQLGTPVLQLTNTLTTLLFQPTFFGNVLASLQSHQGTVFTFANVAVVRHSLRLAIVPMPKPLLTGEIPSLHDNLAITWRIYQPVRPRGDIGAIVAHPYAPLGGSFDDPVVGLVVDALLEAGVVVGTFSFRCVL